MDTDEKKSEDIVDQKPNEPEEKNNNEAVDSVKAEENKTEDNSQILKNIEANLLKINEGLGTVKEMDKNLRGFGERLDKLESRMDSVAPNYLEDDRVKIAGYYDYDAANMKFKNEGAEREREHAFKILEELKEPFI